MTDTDLIERMTLSQAPKVGRKPLKERTRRPNEALTYSVNHVIRIEALAILHIGEFSAGEVADMIGEDVKIVSNHLRDLYNAGSIEFVGHKVVGNFRKAVYRAVALPVVSDEAYRAMSMKDRHDANGAIIQWFLAECLSSYRNEKMDRDEDLCLIWNDPILDAEGKRELRELLTATWKGDPEDQTAALEGIQDIESRAANRMAESGEVGTKMVVGLFAFERGRAGRPKGGLFGPGENER